MTGSQNSLLGTMQAAVNGSSTSTLQVAGIAGFFGGTPSVQAMNNVHLYAGRRWLGWYNSPGSYEVARAYGRSAKSRMWDGFFPGPSHDSAALLGLDVKDGPSYRGVHSGTVMSKTGHAARLLVEACEATPTSISVKGRRPATLPVSIVHLKTTPEAEIQPVLIQDRKHWDAITAVIPILSSATAAGACALVGDTYCGGMIVLGMIVGGISHMIIGSGKLVFTHPTPAEGAPLGDGILDDGTGITVVLGSEGAVSAVTRGSFSLRFGKEATQSPSSTSPRDEDSPNQRTGYDAVSACALLSRVQFLAQLVLVPQGTLFGQLLFLASLFVSWAYNTRLCAADRGRAPQRLLTQAVLGEPQTARFLLPTRTAQAMFVLLALASAGEAKPERAVLADVLMGLLPNRTRVWELWRAAAVRVAEDPETSMAAELDGLSGEEAALLEGLVGDAEAARAAFNAHRGVFEEGAKVRGGCAVDA